MDRFDDCVRSERYFTATLLPTVLFHDDLRGLREFVGLVDSRALTEHDPKGKQQPRADVDFDFSDPEIITEFHIARDVSHYGGLLAGADDETEDDGLVKRDAPDVVIVLGDELIVVEGKFFVGFSKVDLQSQLGSQRRQVRHLFENRPNLRAFRHVALIPEALEGLDCDAVITWDDIAKLSRDMLGHDHYVTQRLDNAVGRFPKVRSGTPGVKNYESALPLAEVLELCRQEHNAVWIGHTGGEQDLRAKGLAYAQAKRWKWRHVDTAGSVAHANWIPGTRFIDLIETLGEPSSAGPAPKHGARNYDGVMGFDQMLAVCREQGANIQVGHTGGEADLLKRGVAFAQSKRWKWRNPVTNQGVIAGVNWIPGDRFVELVDRLT